MLENYAVDDNGYAATSLIGAVGGSGTEGNGISLTFSKIVLPSGPITGGNAPANKPAIFKNALLLQSFTYGANAGSAGTYNFNQAEDWDSAGAHLQRVTYGKEIYSSVENADKQYWYYDTNGSATGYVSAKEKNASAPYADFANYLPYVAAGYDSEKLTHELEVNTAASDLTEGCGTYSHPYKISTILELQTAAKLTYDGTANTGMEIQARKEGALQTECTGDTDANDIVYTYDGSKWVSEDSAETKTTDAMLAYMENAYYQITADIGSVSAPITTFTGFGGNTHQFRGVIVGAVKESGTATSIYLAGETEAKGLINESYGSVVKNLNLIYSGTKALNTANTTDMAKLGYFGGVFGHIRGGDNIIDAVQVTIPSGFISFSSSNYNYLIPMGGYVGMVGGGGVVFRNMRDADGAAFSLATDAKATNMAVETNTAYLYANPFVGRALDGFAVYEITDTSMGKTYVSALNNTNKNYKINTLDTRKTGDAADITTALAAKYETFYYYTTTVKSAQGLFLLSAIANSGAAGNGDQGSYAYYSAKAENTSFGINYGNGSYGKVRNASYNSIGELNSEDYATSKNDDFNAPTPRDAAGTVTNKNLPYLIQHYTDARGLTSRFCAAYTRYDIELSKGNYNMADFGSGYRGIGGRYKSAAIQTGSDTFNADRYSPFVRSLIGNGSQISLDMQVKEYAEDNYKASAVGGVFTALQQENMGGKGGMGATDGSDSGKCVVSNLTIGGTASTPSTVSLTYYDTSGEPANITGKKDNNGNLVNTYYGVGVGGFAGRSATRPAENRNDNFTSKFTEVTLQYLQVLGAYNAGGLIGNTGITSYSNGASHSGGTADVFAVELTNCSYNHITVEADYAAGGFVGASGGNSGDYGGNSNPTNKFLATNAANAVIASDSKITVRNTGSTSYGAGAFIGFCSASLQVNPTETPRILPLQIQAVTISSKAKDGEKNYVGGLVGYLAGTGHTIQANQVNLNAITLAVENGVNSSAAGGLVGYTAGTVDANGVVLQSSTLKACQTGGLVGRLAATLNGSNLLWKDNMIGSAGATPVVGTWVGSAATNRIQLAGVSRQATTSEAKNAVPSQDVGDKAYDGYIAYADYTGSNQELAQLETTNTPTNLIRSVESDQTYTLYIEEQLDLSAPEGYTWGTPSSDEMLEKEIIQGKTGEQYVRLMALKAGTATITATSADNSASITCTIEITDKEKKINGWVLWNRTPEQDTTISNGYKADSYINYSEGKLSTYTKPAANVNPTSNGIYIFPVNTGEKYQIISKNFSRFRVGLFSGDNIGPSAGDAYNNKNYISNQDSNSAKSNTNLIDGVNYIADLNGLYDNTGNANLQQRSDCGSSSQYYASSDSDKKYDDDPQFVSITIPDFKDANKKHYLVVFYFASASGPSEDDSWKNLTVNKWGTTTESIPRNTSKICIASMPTKTSYTLGEKLDTSGLVVMGSYGEDGWRTLPATEYTVSGFDSSKTGYQTIIVNYSGTTTETVAPVTFQVAVNEPKRACYVTTSPQSSFPVTGAGETKYLWGDGLAKAKDGTAIGKLIGTDIAAETPTNAPYTTADSSWSGTPFDYANNLSTYKANQTGSVGEALPDDDFTVLRISGAEGYQKAIKHYLDVLTNGGYTRAVVAGAAKAEVSTYLYKNDRFELETDAAQNALSVTGSGSNLNYVTTTHFDNDQNRFTLLAVTFDAGDAGNFTLYVPIIVRRVLEIDFMATLTYGSVFKPDEFDKLKAHILESYGNTITAYLTYQYNSQKGNFVDYGWQSYLEAGGNLLETFDKTISFGDSAKMPADTQLTLIDKQNADAAYTMTLSAESASVKLNDFKGLDGTPSFTGKTIGEIMGATAVLDPANGKFVQPNDAKEATVKTTDGTYYRLAGPDDTSDKKYSITLSNSDRRPTENYYLVITTPANSGDVTTSINGAIGTSLETTLPKEITQVHRYDNTLEDKKENTESTYSIYTSYRQTLSDNSPDGQDTQNHKELKADSSNTVNIDLLQTITFDTKQSYQEADNLYLQFAANILQTISSKQTAMQFPAGTSGTATFYVYRKNDPEAKTYYAPTTSNGLQASSGETVAASYGWVSDGGNMVLTLSRDGTQAQALSLARVRQDASAAGEFYVELKMAVNFSAEATDSVFPSCKADLNTSVLPNDYAQFNYTARLAAVPQNLSYSSIKTSLNGRVKYFLNQSSSTKLTYKAGNVDQLGINCNDLPSNGLSQIDTVATYDVRKLQNRENNLKDSECVQLKLYLEKRSEAAFDDYAKVEDDNRTYITVSVGDETVEWNATESAFVWTLQRANYASYLDADKEKFTIPVTLTVNTDVENQNHTYANYHMVAGVSLLGSDGKVIDKPENTDYITYTLARVSTSMLPHAN